VPSVAVATVKLLFVDDAKNLYKLDILVVATTPFTVEVITPEFAERLFEFIMPALVVDTTPLTTLVHIYEFVLVDTVSMFVVLLASSAAGVTCCTSPFGPSISSGEVADPVPTFVSIVVARVAVEVATKLPLVIFVPVALPNTKLEMNPDNADKVSVNQFVLVPFTIFALFAKKFVLVEFTNVDDVAVTLLKRGLFVNE
jgi:hypothetical protein